MRPSKSAIRALFGSPGVTYGLLTHSRRVSAASLNARPPAATKALWQLAVAQLGVTMAAWM